MAKPALIQIIVLLALIQVATMSPLSKGTSDWGDVHIGRDAEGHWEAVLENSLIRVRYGYKKPDDYRQGMITDFTLKDYPDENIAGHLMDAAAHRGEITDIELIQNDEERITIRVAWAPSPAEKKDFPEPAVSEISIFRNQPFLRIDYIAYCFPHVVDIGTPGGLECAATDASCTSRYTIYGASRWKSVRQSITADSLRHHPNEHHRVTDDLYPLYPNPLIDGGWNLAASPLSYEGWYILGVYNKMNGRGFGRVVPYDAVPYVKLLWNKGLELFPYWQQTAEPHTEYLFAGTSPTNLMEMGKYLVDELIAKGGRPQYR